MWAWWTDFGEPGRPFRMRHGLGSSTRTILSRAPDAVVLEDRSILGILRREVRIHADRTLTEVGSGGQTFESTWRFEAVGPDRTRVTRRMRARGAKALEPFARLVASQDLRYHCRVASRELRAH